MIILHLTPGGKARSERGFTERFGQSEKQKLSVRTTTKIVIFVLLYLVYTYIRIYIRHFQGEEEKTVYMTLPTYVREYWKAKPQVEYRG